MGRDKLTEIAGRLGVSGRDISDIKRNYWKDYFLYIGAAIALGAVFFVLGCCNGGMNNAANNVVNNAVNNVNNGYPYASVLPGAAARGKNRIILGLLGITAFLVLIATPVFGEAIRYNVYRRS